MYGHVPDYLNAQALRLRAERWERLARIWRLTGWAFGLAFVCLLAVVVWQERQLAVTTASLDEQREFNFELGWANEGLKVDLVDLQKEQKVLRADLADAEKFYQGEQSEIYVALQRAVDAEEAADAAKKRFTTCKSANAGLVESLQDFDQLVKDQQALIVESVELAKRCEASPVTWAAAAPEGWQVVDHAR